MSALIALDTNVVIWLYSRDLAKFSPRAYALANHTPFMVPAFVWLELMLMEQKGNKLSMSMREVQSSISALPSFARRTRFPGRATRSID